MLTLFRQRFPSVDTTGMADGVDLSGWQAPSIWPSLGWVKWSCAKVSEGSTFVESTAIDHSAAANTRGIPWGLYHFAKFTDVHGEAQRYLAGVDMVARNLGRQPWYHMLDLEAPAGRDVTAWSEQWCQIVEQTIALPIIVYTGPGWANQYLTQRGTGLERRPLWVAHYANAGTAAPWVPSIWSDWMIWQWSSSTSLGSLDVNVAKQSFMGLLQAGGTTGDEDLTPEQAEQLRQVHWSTNATFDKYGRAVSHPDMIDMMFNNFTSMQAKLDEITGRVAGVEAKVASVAGTPQVTADQVASSLLRQVIELATKNGA